MRGYANPQICRRCAGAPLAQGFADLCFTQPDRFNSKSCVFSAVHPRVKFSTWIGKSTGPYKTLTKVRKRQDPDLRSYPTTIPVVCKVYVNINPRSLLILLTIGFTLYGWHLCPAIHFPVWRFRTLCPIQWVSKADTSVRAMHYRPRPVATSGVFASPKKVRTLFIYSCDEWLRRPHPLHLFSEWGRRVGVSYLMRSGLLRFAVDCWHMFGIFSMSKVNEIANNI